MSLQKMFAEQVRAERRAKGYTQLALALASGLDRTYISDMERGRKCPSLKTCEKLAAALDMEIIFAHRQ